MILDHPHFYVDERPFVPIIFDAGPGEEAPEGFNTVRIPLEGHMRAHLDWRLSIQRARSQVEKGLKLIWDLDLGLFNRLSLPFADETQFKALALSVDHFLNDVWPSFADDTLGLCVYRGGADFSQSYPWCYERREALQTWLQGQPDTPRLRKQFCSDTAIQYLEFLVGGFPATLQPFLFLDAYSLMRPLEAAQLLSRDKLSRFYTAVRGSCLPVREIGWESNHSPYGFLGRKLPQIEPETITVGVCITDATQELEAKLEELTAKRIRFKVLSETFLTSEWDGLDEIIVGPVSDALQRKLQGFIAAGGKVTVVVKDG